MRARTEPSLLPSLTRILDPAERDHYWRAALRLWRLEGRERQPFPGSHPMPVDARTASLMRDDAYVVALKTDGVRFLLLLTLAKDKADPIALMIDRSLVMYEVCVWANYEFFQQGTLYDGELAWNVDANDETTHAMSYCVFDAVCVAGAHVADRPFAERLQVIHDSLFRAWKPLVDDADLEAHVRDEHKVLCRQLEPYALSFVAKTQVPFAQMRSLWAQRRVACSQRVDGLLFTARQARMHVGRTDAILKWKPVHTVDVALRRKEEGEGEEEEVEVLVDARRVAAPRAAARAAEAGEGGAARVEAVRVVRNQLGGRALPRGGEGRVVECAWPAKGRGWWSSRPCGGGRTRATPTPLARWRRRCPSPTSTWTWWPSTRPAAVRAARHQTPPARGGGEEGGEDVSPPRRTRRVRVASPARRPAGA